MRSSIKTKADFDDFSELIISLLNDLGFSVKQEYGFCTFEVKRTFTVHHKREYDLSFNIYLDRIRIKPNLNSLIMHIKREIPIFYNFEVLHKDENCRNTWLNLIRFIVDDLDYEVSSYLDKTKENKNGLHWELHRF